LKIYKEIWFLCITQLLNCIIDLLVEWPLNALVVEDLTKRMVA